jgi:hypothetical protein
MSQVVIACERLAALTLIQIPCPRTPHKLLRRQAAREVFSSRRKQLISDVGRSMTCAPNIGCLEAHLSRLSSVSSIRTYC